jgi:hypothetical protein
MVKDGWRSLECSLPLKIEEAHNYKDIGQLSSLPIS